MPKCVNPDLLWIVVNTRRWSLIKDNFYNKLVCVWKDFFGFGFTGFCQCWFRITAWKAMQATVLKENLMLWFVWLSGLDSVLTLPFMAASILTSYFPSYRESFSQWLTPHSYLWRSFTFTKVLQCIVRQQENVSSYKYSSIPKEWLGSR